MNATKKKITRTTFKTFIARNRDRLMIRTESSFNGMTDCVQRTEARKFRPVSSARPGYELGDLGIDGVWLVGHGRDWYSAFEADGMTGIHVTNCCGSFTVAVATAEGPSIPLLDIALEHMTGDAARILKEITDNLQPWEKMPTRETVADILRRQYHHDALVTVGGHHVAVNFDTPIGPRILITSRVLPDFN